ncbi:PREDICTED: uncharacterized protein LOC108609460 [Drosophila arizonae]|uniref:Uncharacterized protein LOC108609460 n=1 Tax=Drosophila arizonae TaxID=7263 RepID=A0ABM1NNY6_DROAR|nr:PREDICTED: uncharacterized protein LOC108609460 [Drosophila arizonae]
MQVKIVALLAIFVMAQQADAGTITFGDLMGDISKVAVAGEKAIHQLENKVFDSAQSEVEHVETAIQNMLSDMANGLDDLANALTNLRAQRDYVQPEPKDLLGSLMGDMGNELGHLANTITSLSVQIQAMPKSSSVSSSGASIIGEVGGLSAQAIASAAHAAAPYVKQLNTALGDLANSLTHL